jgi:hypothetical protein
MSISGIFPGDFDNRTSPKMIFHAMGSFVFFLIAAFAYPKQFRISEYREKVIKPSLIFTILFLLVAFYE